MKTTKQARRGAKELFRACLANGLLDETRVGQAVQRMVEIKPRGYLKILTHFQRLVKLDLARRSVRIESAIPLPPGEQNSVQGNLTRLYGLGLTFAFAQNPALIGGMRIRVGSDVYDGTIQGRLAQLQETL